MSEELFEREQRGKGCDALCPKDERLKFKWRWIPEERLSWVRGDLRNKSKKRRPCQCSEAVLKNGWIVRVSYWYNHYEAIVERSTGEAMPVVVESYGDMGKAKNKLLCTRLDAQLKAEQMFEELGRDILIQATGD